MISDSSARSNLVEEVDGNGSSSIKLPVESAVPQWKLDFLAKKKSLLEYQKGLERRTVARSNNNGSSGGSSKEAKTTGPTKKSYGSNSEITLPTHDKAIVSQDRTHLNNGELKDYTPREPAASIVAPADFSLATAPTMDGDKENEKSDCSETDSDASTNSKSLKRNGKSGGYSFLTGERTTGEPESSSSESSESDTESETEGSAEFTYKPGIVSKLLNKFSTISYHGHSTVPNGFTSSSRKTTPFVTTNMPRPNRIGVTDIHSKPSALMSEEQSVVTDLTSPRSPPISESINTRLQESRSAPAKTGKDRPPKITTPNRLNKQSSFRAPDEILLIEGPHDELPHSADILETADNFTMVSSDDAITNTLSPNSMPDAKT